MDIKTLVWQRLGCVVGVFVLGWAHKGRHLEHNNSIIEALVHLDRQWRTTASLPMLSVDWTLLSSTEQPQMLLEHLEQLEQQLGVAPNAHEYDVLLHTILDGYGKYFLAYCPAWVRTCIFLVSGSLAQQWVASAVQTMVGLFQMGADPLDHHVLKGHMHWYVQKMLCSEPQKAVLQKKSTSWEQWMGSQMAGWMVKTAAQTDPCIDFLVHTSGVRFCVDHPKSVAKWEKTLDTTSLQWLMELRSLYQRANAMPLVWTLWCVISAALHLSVGVLWAQQWIDIIWVALIFCFSCCVLWSPVHRTLQRYLWNRWIKKWYCKSSTYQELGVFGGQYDQVLSLYLTQLLTQKKHTFSAKGWARSQQIQHKVEQQSYDWTNTDVLWMLERLMKVPKNALVQVQFKEHVFACWQKKYLAQKMQEQNACSQYADQLHPEHTTVAVQSGEQSSASIRAPRRL